MMPIEDRDVTTEQPKIHGNLMCCHCGAPSRANASDRT